MNLPVPWNLFIKEVGDSFETVDTLLLSLHEEVFTIPFLLLLVLQGRVESTMGYLVVKKGGLK